MPATMEQTKIDQLPTATLDEEGSVINATVIISPGDEPGTYRHHVSALSAAGPTDSHWTVIWTLETTGFPPGSSPIFREGGGIIVPRQGTFLPDGVELITTDLELLPNQRHLTFSNHVADVNVIRYDFDLVQGGLPLTKSADIIIDPTIAVVKEPIDG